MSSAISQAIRQANQQGRAAFIPYVTGDFPDPATCLEFIKALDAGGADVIEVGIPFSDPLADGPVIQRSSTMALEQGTTPASVLELVSSASKQITAPLVVMTYLNPVFKMGPEKFAALAKASGAAGTIIPDLPPEHADMWLGAAGENNLDSIFMAAPTTTPDRLRMIYRLGGGFLYYVSMTGVTGSDLALDPGTLQAIAHIRRESPLPVAVGFGVAQPKQAANLAQAADGVIVGSALVKEFLQAGPDRQKGLSAAGSLAAEIASALVRPSS